jgi:Na+-translocating ferredoxin:NAD+ oxidoreductase RnfE subunit
MPAGLVLAAIPLALASNSLVGGLALGVTSGVMLGLALLLRIGFRRAIPPEIHLPVAALVLTGAVSALDRLLDAYLHALHPAIGGPLPLVAGAGLMLVFGADAKPRPGALPPARNTWIFPLVPIVLPPLVGAVRELLATGALAQLPRAGTSSLPVFDAVIFPLAAWPTGGFILLALLIAAGRVVRDRHAANEAGNKSPQGQRP